jgi:formate hydrogenlyase transcriptional activator
VEGVPTAGVAKASLEELLTFERLLADLSATFSNVSGDQLDTEIERALRRLLEFLGFDRSNFGEFNADGRAIILCSVATGGVEQYPPGPAPVFLNWYNGELHAGKIVHVRSLDDLPAEATGEAEYYRRSGIRSSLAIPVPTGNQIRRYW